MSMYKELYKVLINRIMEAMEKTDEAIIEARKKEDRRNLYEIYGILMRAQQEAEEIIMRSDEEI